MPRHTLRFWRSSSAGEEQPLLGATKTTATSPLSQSTTKATGKSQSLAAFPIKLRMITRIIDTLYSTIDTLSEAEDQQAAEGLHKKYQDIPSFYQDKKVFSIKLQAFRSELETNNITSKPYKAMLQVLKKCAHGGGSYQEIFKATDQVRALPVPTKVVDSPKKGLLVLLQEAKVATSKAIIADSRAAAKRFGS